MTAEELTKVEVPVTLKYHQLKAAKSALNSQIGKMRREMEKKPFTPEPGHINLTEAKIKTAQEAHDVLTDALIKVLDKEGVVPEELLHAEAPAH